MDRATRAFRSGGSFLTVGGTETYLMFQQGFALRDMCAFDVLDDDPDRIDRDAVVLDQKETFETVDVGTIILATGFKTFDASQLPAFARVFEPFLATTLQ